MGLMSFGFTLMELASKFQLESQITVSYFAICWEYQFYYLLACDCFCSPHFLSQGTPTCVALWRNMGQRYWHSTFDSCYCWRDSNFIESKFNFYSRSQARSYCEVGTKALDSLQHHLLLEVWFNIHSWLFDALWVFTFSSNILSL